MTGSEEPNGSASICLDLGKIYPIGIDIGAQNGHLHQTVTTETYLEALKQAGMPYPMPLFAQDRWAAQTLAVSQSTARGYRSGHRPIPERVAKQLADLKDRSSR